MAEVSRSNSLLRLVCNASTPQKRHLDLVEILGFLFMLSTMELGRVNLLVNACQAQTNVVT